jgi:putrescine transport system substrate-binding protein
MGLRIWGLLLGTAVAAGLGLGPALADEEKVVNVYNWSDYIGEHTIADFEKETGIKVRYDVYDSNETLEAKLLAGKSGYDVVVPSSGFLGRQIKAGVFQKLDKGKMPNLSGLDPELMKRVASLDPDNGHATIYAWGTVGLGMNIDKIKQRMADAPVDSWDIIFKPENAKKFKDCGIAMLDSPTDILEVALHYLGKSPYSDKKADIDAAEKLLLSIRPYVKYFHSSRYIDDLVNGELCLVIGWSGDVFIAKGRAEEAKNKVNIEYHIPKEGTQIFFDMMAVPADAPHPDNAMKFINFTLQPAIEAAFTNFVKYPNAVAASLPLIDKDIRDDPSIYPPPEVMAKLFPDKIASPALDRLRTRAWTRIKTGK